MEILPGFFTCYIEIFHLDQKHFQAGHEDSDPDVGESTGSHLQGSVFSWWLNWSTSPMALLVPPDPSPAFERIGSN